MYGLQLSDKMRVAFEYEMATPMTKSALTARRKQRSRQQSLSPGALRSQVTPVPAAGRGDRRSLESTPFKLKPSRSSTGITDLL